MIDAVSGSDAVEKPKGRPRNANSVRYLPRMIVSIPQRVKDAIAYLCERQNRTQSELFQAALLAYVVQLPRTHRPHVAALIRGTKSEDPGITCVDVPVHAKPAVEAFVQLWVSPKNSYELAARRFFMDFFDLAED
jgi:hypothetical protein